MQATGDEVYMNIPDVQGFAKSFADINGTLTQVSSALEALMQVLKGTAFVGLVGGAAEQHYIEVMKTQIDQMAAKADEVSKDVAAAVDAYERGDAQGATRFY